MYMHTLCESEIQQQNLILIAAPVSLANRGEDISQPSGA